MNLVAKGLFVAALVLGAGFAAPGGATAADAKGPAAVVPKGAAAPATPPNPAANDIRIAFAPGTEVIRDLDWRRVGPVVTEALNPWYLGPTGFPVNRGVLSAAKVDLNGDGSPELLVTLMGDVCKTASYCYTLVFDLMQLNARARSGNIALGKGPDGLPYLVQRRADAVDKQVLCTTGFCVTGQYLQHCTVLTDPLCVPPNPAKPRQDLAARAFAPAGGEQLLPLVRGAANDATENERAALETWIAAEWPDRILERALAKQDMLLGFGAWRVDLTGTGPKELVVTGLGPVGGCHGDGTCEVTVLKRLATEFATDTTVVDARASMFAQVPTWIAPDGMVELRTTYEQPNLWTALVPGINDVLDSLRVGGDSDANGRQSLRGDLRDMVRLGVPNLIGPPIAGPGAFYVTLDPVGSRTSLPPFAARTELRDGAINIGDRVPVVAGLAVRLVVDAQGRRTIRGIPRAR